jgi:hypothetical protein
MRQTIAFHKASSFIAASVQQTVGMCKPQKEFISWLLITWVLLPVRHNFLNLFRYGNGEYREKSIRQQLGSKIPR